MFAALAGDKNLKLRNSLSFFHQAKILNFSAVFDTY